VCIWEANREGMRHCWPPQLLGRGSYDGTTLVTVLQPLSSVALSPKVILHPVPYFTFVNQ
jgi:hypothetical protein